MKINFLATTTGSRLDLFEDLIISFNELIIPIGFNVHLFVLDQSPTIHNEIFRRNLPNFGKKITRVESSSLLGLSVARNRLLARLNGDCYVIFCDDDATYPPDFLIKLQREFINAGQVDIGIFNLLNKGEVETYGGRWYPSRSRSLSKHEVVNLAISLNLIIKLKCINAVGGFNVELGVGSKGFCGEETELILKIIDSGARANYFSSPIAYHPKQELPNIDPKKIYTYSRGYREMLLSYKGSLYLKALVRLHLAIAILKSLLALIVFWQQRKIRLIKLKGLLGIVFNESSYD